MKADANLLHGVSAAVVQDLSPAPRRGVQGADLSGRLWVIRQLRSNSRDLQLHQFMETLSNHAPCMLIY